MCHSVRRFDQIDATRFDAEVPGLPMSKKSHFDEQNSWPWEAADITTPSEILGLQELHARTNRNSPSRCETETNSERILNKS
jgi:hypothetical protein